MARVYLRHDLNDLLEEIIRAPGWPAAKPVSDAPFKERFSSAFPAIRDFAPRLEIDLGQPDGAEGPNGKPAA